MNKNFDKSIRNVTKNFINVNSTDLILEAESLTVSEQIVPEELSRNPAKQRANVSLELPEFSGFPETRTEVLDDDYFTPLSPPEQEISQEFHDLIKSNRRNKLKRKLTFRVPDLSKRFCLVYIEF